MKDLQSVFSRLQKNRKRAKELRSMYKDSLDQTPGYKDMVEDLRARREKKKQVELTVRESFSSEMTELEDLKIDISSDVELLSDIALTQYTKGQTVEVQDEYDNEYMPVFKVSFKKTN